MVSYNPITYIWNYLTHYCIIRTKKKEIFGIWKQRSDAYKMILFGLFGMLAVQYTYFASIKEGNAAVATLLQYLAPIFITVYLLFKWNVRPSKIDFISITLSLVGTFLLLTNGSVHNLAVSTPAIIWGFYLDYLSLFIVYIQRDY